MESWLGGFGWDVRGVVIAVKEGVKKLVWPGGKGYEGERIRRR